MLVFLYLTVSEALVGVMLVFENDLTLSVMNLGGELYVSKLTLEDVFK